MEREWGNGARDRMRERMNFISVFPSLCCKTLKFLTFCHKTLKYVTFCRKMLKYGTFCRECRKNRNIRAMRKWFWIKSGCEEAPQVVPAWRNVECSKHIHPAEPIHPLSLFILMEKVKISKSSVMRTISANARGTCMRPWKWLGVLQECRAWRFRNWCWKLRSVAGGPS